jgi:hypothetical protein
VSVLGHLSIFSFNFYAFFTEIEFPAAKASPQTPQGTTHAF